MNASKNELSGLQRLCRAYGRMKCGETMMVWDYANKCAVPESEMKTGSEPRTDDVRQTHRNPKALGLNYG